MKIGSTYHTNHKYHKNPCRYAKQVEKNEKETVKK